MTTLAEIQAAAETLPLAQKEELALLLNRQVEQERKEKAGCEKSFAEFAGVLRLREDPLDWQRAVRNEW